MKVRHAGILVANVGGEELQIPLPGFDARKKERRVMIDRPQPGVVLFDGERGSGCGFHLTLIKDVMNGN
jgi:hypothetical protein